MKQYITDITHVPYFQTLKHAEQELLERVTSLYPFKASNHYLSLIDWDNPKDPLKRIIFPHPDELNSAGCLDPSQENRYTAEQGLQHKYPQTVLLLLSDECGGICRFCFRKRLFMESPRQTIRDYSASLEYIASHPEVTDVLLSGGDPLTLQTSQLQKVIQEIEKIDHIKIIRIGTKMLAYNPSRITEDRDLVNLIRSASSAEKKIYIMAHFNHPNEISPQSIKAIQMLHQAGALVVNQTPVIEGVNADPKIMTELFKKLSNIGVSPYYVFQCRPTIGNRSFTVPVERSYKIMQKAFQQCSGLAKRARFIISHSTGKIEIVGQNRHNVFMRYHQAHDPDKYNQFLICQSNPQARWFDEYQLITPASNPIREWLFEGEPTISDGAIIS